MVFLSSWEMIQSESSLFGEQKHPYPKCLATLFIPTKQPIKLLARIFISLPSTGERLRELDQDIVRQLKIRLSSLLRKTDIKSFLNLLELGLIILRFIQMVSPQVYLKRYSRHFIVQSLGLKTWRCYKQAMRLNMILCSPQNLDQPSN